MNFKTNLIDIYMKCMFLFPIVTVFPDKGIVTKFLFGILIICQIGLYLKKGIRKKTLKQLVLMCVLYIITLMQTRFPMSNYNMLFYYPFYVAFSFFVIDNNRIILKWLNDNEYIVRAVIKIWTVIVGVSIFIPSCYYIKEGGTFYFGSFVNTIFRLGPAAIFIQASVLVSMSLYKRRKDIIYMIVPMYAFLMGSSRTYLLIGGCLFLISWYWFGVKKKTFMLTCIPLVFIGAYFIVHSALWDKVQYSLDESQYGDFWFRITSSRSVLWAKDLSAWKSGNLIQKLCGSGIERTFYETGLWAHNDFIEMLCGFGLIGLVQYLYTTITLIKKYLKVDVVKLIKVCVVMMWFTNAFFNMHYTYFCATLAYPLALLAIHEYYKSKNLVNGNEINLY